MFIDQTRVPKENNQQTDKPDQSSAQPTERVHHPDETPHHPSNQPLNRALHSADTPPTPTERVHHPDETPPGPSNQPLIPSSHSSHSSPQPLIPRQSGASSHSSHSSPQPLTADQQRNYALLTDKAIAIAPPIAAQLATRYNFKDLCHQVATWWDELEQGIVRGTGALIHRLRHRFSVARHFDAFLQSELIQRHNLTTIFAPRKRSVLDEFAHVIIR